MGPSDRNRHRRVDYQDRAVMCFTDTYCQRYSRIDLEPHVPRLSRLEQIGKACALLWALRRCRWPEAQSPSFAAPMPESRRDSLQTQQRPRASSGMQAREAPSPLPLAALKC